MGWNLQIDLQLPETRGPSFPTLNACTSSPSAVGYPRKLLPLLHNFNLFLEAVSQSCALCFLIMS